MDLGDYLKETDSEVNFIKAVECFLDNDTAATKGPFIRVSVSKDTMISRTVPSLQAETFAVIDMKRLGHPYIFRVRDLVHKLALGVGDWSDDEYLIFGTIPVNGIKT